MRIFLLFLCLLLPLFAELEVLIQPTDDSSEKVFIWALEPDKHYRLDTTTTFDHWSEGEVFKAEDVTFSQQISLGAQDRSFYRLVRVDREAPLIRHRYPKNGDFSVPRFSQMTIALTEEGAINPASITLSVGGQTYTVSDQTLTLTEDQVLILDPVDHALGGYEEEVAVRLEVADELGNEATYEWVFTTALETVVAPNIFVFGSPQAQRTGQNLRVREATMARAVGTQIIRKPANSAATGWSIDHVTDGAVIITGPTKESVQNTHTVGQLIANEVPTSTEEIFYREITAISQPVQNVPFIAWKTTLSTVDRTVESFIESGSFSMSENPTFLEIDGDGNHTAVVSETTTDYSFDNSSYKYGIEVALPGGFSQDWSDSVISDESGAVQLSFQEDQFGITYSPSVGAYFDFKGWKLDKGAVALRGDFNAVCRPVLNLAISGEYSFEKELYSSKTLRAKGAIGVVPIWVDFTLSAGISGTVSGALTAEVNTGFELNISSEAAATYDRNASPAVTYHSPTNRLESENDGITVDATADFTSRFQVNPTVATRIYGLIGFDTQVIPYVTVGGEATARLSTDGDQEFYSTLYATAGIDCDISLQIEHTDVDDLVPSFNAPVIDPWEWSAIWPDYTPLIADSDPESPALEFSWRVEPQSQTLNEGSSIVLFAQGLSNYTMSYQWYKNDIPIPGANASRYVISEAQPNHEGSYTCEITTKNEPQVSIESVLTILKREESVVEYVKALDDADITESMEGRIATGDGHILYISSDNTLWGQGDNYSGQLGDGTTIHRSTPVKISSNVRQVYVTGSTSYYITKGGELWGMGRNNYGQLGDGSTASRAAPVKIASNVRQFYGKGDVGYYVTQSDELWGMGRNNYGQLGDGSTANRANPVKIVSNVRQVYTTGVSSHYVTQSGELWGMGRNNYGQVGNGSISNITIPVKIASNVRQVYGGTTSTSYYITENSELWGMGHNYYGQIGNGSKWNVTIPVKIASNVRQVYGTTLTAHYLTQSGELWGMGRSFYGQIGDGYAIMRATPVKIASNVRQVYGADSTSCYITKGNELWGMGSNRYGKLGDGSTTNRSKPVKIANNVRQFSGTYSMSLYVTQSGEIFGIGFSYGVFPVQIATGL